MHDSVLEPAPEVAPEKKTGAKGPRFVFVDLLRGFALVVMIETHVINAYLPASQRHTPFFFWLSFLNGLVAPTFLFASGFSIILQGNRQWDDWLHFRSPFWRQMRRLGFITLVAYYSHIQDFKLSKYLQPEDPDLWPKTLQVDVLQCIVASLLVLHILILLTRKHNRFAWAAAALAVAAAIATPLMWARDFRAQVPLALVGFLNPHGVSLFPLFPWLSFVLAGSCAAYVFLRSVERGFINRYMLASATVGAGFIAGGLVLRHTSFTIPGHVSFYTTSPLYVLVRLGCVLIICVLLYWLERSQIGVPGPVRLAGQESLLVYGVHLAVIFGFLRGKFVGPVLGREAGYLGCWILSGLIIVSMLWLARVWHGVKHTYPRFTRSAQAAVVLIMMVVFTLR